MVVQEVRWFEEGNREWENFVRIGEEGALFRSWCSNLLYLIYLIFFNKQEAIRKHWCMQCKGRCYRSLRLNEKTRLPIGRNGEGWLPRT